MRFQLTIVLAAAVALLASSAAVARAAPHTVLKVRACQVGNTAKERQATFYGRMRSVPHARRMMMRFTLIDRSDGAATVVPAPQLAPWRRSRPGVKAFGYAQTVAGLQTGGAYAAAVEYRWLGAHGKTIKTTRRTSAECRQDGALPNLTITRVAARRGDAAGTLLYSVDVVNTGPAVAHGVVVDLFVDDAGADAATVDTIVPGQVITVRVAGPPCRARLRAVADRKDRIHETTEDDNVLRSRCPAVAG
jgi:hypothetical protein